jgi:KUP system potassium uptake protein
MARSLRTFDDVRIESAMKLQRSRGNRLARWSLLDWRVSSTGQRVIVGSTAQARPASSGSGWRKLTLGALGVVFGDIGTSPLYTFKTVLGFFGNAPDASVVLGLLSLIVWTLVLIASVKYVSIAMRIDNDGEGGILALMALLGVKRHHRPLLVAIGLLGAALIYGDGAITPAISVLSAVEGLGIAAPPLSPYVLPIGLVILVGLFGIQPAGTARIGVVFGPIMALWFVVLGLLGLWGIAQHPSVLSALSPTHAITFLQHHGVAGFLVLGGVFLCVTGAEALYADMGHFGAGPIRLAWGMIVFPSLILNYCGQAAITLSGADIGGNVFYRLCPQPMLPALIALATLATIIASQSIITGAFSMTRQAMQLGWFPPLRIVQTSDERYGQIYVGAINWALMVTTIGLAAGFGKSDHLAAAYGIAVSATMLITSVLLLTALHEVLGWNRILSAAVGGAFLIIDAAFLSANAAKFGDGGYAPIAIAALVYGVMLIWHRGAKAVSARLQADLVPIDTFLAELQQQNIPRVPGTAVFLSRARFETPPVLVWHLKHNRSLHKHVVLLMIEIASVPWTKKDERSSIAEPAPRFWRVVVRFGFMERPRLANVLAELKERGCSIDLNDVTYYVGHETVTSDVEPRSLPRWQEALFAYMQRNSAHIQDILLLPSEQTIEIGRQVGI